MYFHFRSALMWKHAQTSLLARSPISLYCYIDLKCCQCEVFLTVCVCVTNSGQLLCLEWNPGSHSAFSATVSGCVEMFYYRSLLLFPIKYAFVSSDVCLFCGSYYCVYDSGDRQPLLEAYHDGACFSLSLPPINNPSRYRVSSL